MIDKSNALQLSKTLSKSLKTKGVTQSEIIELIAQYNGYKDWNTFCGCAADPFNNDESGWSPIKHIHIDNGGFDFKFNEKLQLLYIGSSFFGYSINEHMFRMSKKEVDKFFFHVYKFLSRPFDENSPPEMICGSNWNISTDGIVLTQDIQRLTIPIYNLEPHHIESIVETIFNKSFSAIKQSKIEDKILNEVQNDDDDALFAVVITLNGGYDSDKEEVAKSGLKIGDKIEIEHIKMHSSSTDLKLYGHKNTFNSVFFKIVNNKGLDVDIFSMKKYNPFL